MDYFDSWEREIVVKLIASNASRDHIEQILKFRSILKYSLVQILKFDARRNTLNVQYL